MTLGSHVSCQGGFAKAVGRAVDAGCDCLQIFVSNPPRQWPVKPLAEAGDGYLPVHLSTKNNNQWAAKPLTSDVIDAWKNAFEASGMQNAIAHASYLINLASPDDALRQKSVDALVVELQRGCQLGLQGLVVHPGAFTKSSEPEGIQRIIESVTETLQRTDAGSCRLLLENTAGQGTCLGHSLGQLAAMLDGINDHDRVGVCFDTCHAFAAGYSLNTPAGFAEMKAEIQDVLPPGSIDALHLNDSKKPLGSRVDRHEHIGRGEIGSEGFRLVLNDDFFAPIPGYIETEKGTDEDSGEEWDKVNLATLRQLLSARS